MTLDKLETGTRRRVLNETSNSRPLSSSPTHQQQQSLAESSAPSLSESLSAFSESNPQPYSRNSITRRSKLCRSIHAYTSRFQRFLLLSTLVVCLYFSKTSTTVHQKSLHKIPNILLFTHYRDLIKEASSLEDEEERVLSANIKHSIASHKPDTIVRFLTDEDCIESLQKVFPSLIPYFLNETQGMFKADICRGSALFETGGIYLDVDVGVRKDLWFDLLPETEFVTSLVHAQSKWPRHFFQAILGAAPESQIIYKYLELFYNHYTGKERVKKGPLGVILLRRAFDAVYDEIAASPATELYQEVLYNRKMFPDLYPAPTWGTRRACHFVVVARAHSSKNVELTHESGKKYCVPLYSRVGGSRMCPINQNVSAQ